MSRLVNQLYVDENIAMFLQYGVSELTINDCAIACEIQQQYEDKLMFDDIAIALEIQQEEEVCLHDDEGYTRTLQAMDGDLHSFLNDDEKLARYLQHEDESASNIDEDIQENQHYQPMQVNHSYIPQRDASSTSRTFSYDEDRDHFSGHYTHILSSSDSSHSFPGNETTDPEHMTYEELNELEDSIGDVGRGLSQRRISKLPTHKYGTKSKTRWWQKKKKFVANDTECSICLVDYAKGDKITTLPCNHIYHKDCISHWLKQNKVCCVCKAEV